MPRYLTSDLHLGHGNIIDHCDRPFDSVETMNETLVDNWNETVGVDDVVFFLGDLGRFADQSQLEDWLDRLHGRVVFIEGNHDKPDRYTTGLNTHQYYLLGHGSREFCLTHTPENAPRFWDGWVVHGHHHNNDLDTYPLVNPGNRTANVSTELTGYRPIAVRDLLDLVERERTVTVLPSE